MSLGSIENRVLEVLKEGDVMTLKMIAREVNKKNQKISKQAVWYALQILVARELVEKVDRGVYRRRRDA
jgi:repressor of nif and glnA expression